MPDYNFPEILPPFQLTAIRFFAVLTHIQRVYWKFQACNKVVPKNNLNSRCVLKSWLGILADSEIAEF